MPDDFSQTNAQSKNTYVLEKKEKKKPPNLSFISLSFAVSDQM